MTITIDGSGRLVLPKEVRDRFHLAGGSRLMVRIQESGVVLLPEQPGPGLALREGVLVSCGETEGDLAAAVERVRESRSREMMDPAGS